MSHAACGVALSGGDHGQRSSLPCAPECACAELRRGDAAQPRSPRCAKVEAALTVKRAADRRIGTLAHNPQISVESGYRDDTGGRGAVVQVAVQQGFYLSGYASARRRSVENEEQPLAIEVRAAILRQRLGTVRLWTELGDGAGRAACP